MFAARAEACAKRDGDPVKNTRWRPFWGTDATLCTVSGTRGRLAAGAIGKLDRAQHENQRLYSRTHG